MHRILATGKLGAARIGNCPSFLENYLKKRRKKGYGITKLIKVLVPI